MYRIIGIDPAFREKGFATCDLILTEDLNTHRFHTYHKPHSFFIDYSTDYELFYFGVENSNLQNLTFRESKKISVAERVSRNVGANQAVSQMVVDFLQQYYGEEKVYEFSPREKGKKDTQEDYVKKCLALKLQPNKRTSQDERDAFKLAYLTYHKVKLLEKMK
jgi:hypothetical protein